MLVSHVSTLVMLVVMMIRLVVVWMVVMLLVFRHLHPISLVILASIHHHMLRLMPVVVVHVESVVRGRLINRRS